MVSGTLYMLKYFLACALWVSMEGLFGGEKGKLKPDIE